MADEDERDIEGGEEVAEESVSRFSGFADKALEVLFGDVGEDGSHQPTIVNQLLLAIIAIIVILSVVNLIKMIVTRIRAYNRGTPWIVKKSKDARHELMISQDPRIESAIPLRRSLNEGDGVEFTYMLWMFVDDWDYKRGSWKHVFHKGNTNSFPNRAPGVWLHPNENKMRIYMNSFQSISNYTDIDNIPVGKWFHLTIVLKQRTLDTYINGFLKKRIVLDGIPRQNFGNLWVNANGGFAGFVSRMRYFDYAVNLTEVEHAMKLGPSLDLPLSAQQKPPYLVPHWWTTEYGQ